LDKDARIHDKTVNVRSEKIYRGHSTHVNNILLGNMILIVQSSDIFFFNFVEILAHIWLECKVKETLYFMSSYDTRRYSYLVDQLKE
jgi:hypothetical protein